MAKQFYVYILSSKRNGTIYVGVTANLIQRIWQHKNKKDSGFTEKYRVSNLVYFEIHDSAVSAITREKQIKKWNRAWKLRLIEEKNPQWIDLYSEICR
jgi:putative endonuclease